MGRGEGGDAKKELYTLPKNLSGRKEKRETRERNKKRQILSRKEKWVTRKKKC